MFSGPATPPLSVGLSATVAGSPEGGGDSFADFWSIWPRKHGKKKAEAEWKRLAPAADLASHIIVAARLWAAHYAEHHTELKWIPEPANWLKLERYDEALPLIHADGKGAAITKAKANAPAKKAKPQAENDNDDEQGPMICDVGPFSPCGKYPATITGSTVELIGPHTEKVVLDLTWNGRGYGPDVQHTFYFQHPDQRVQERGQAFVRTLAEILDIDDLSDTEQLHGGRVTCNINSRLAISYGRAA
jgi:hypothetical protein